MITTLLALFLTLIAGNDDDRPATIELREGTKKGVITKIDNAAITLRTSEGSVDLPRDQVMAIDAAPPGVINPATMKVAVALEGDGLLNAIDITTDDREAMVTLSDKQPIALPMAGIRGVLFGPASPSLFDEWKRKCAETRAHDVLLADKKGEQAELDGSVGTIGPERVNFKVDGESVDVRRERVRGIYFANNQNPSRSPITIFEVTGHRWPAEKIEWNSLGVKLSSDLIGSQLRQTSDIARIDFSSGRIIYLSDLEPAKADYLPYLDTSWPMRKDCNYSNNPIRIGTNTFRKGLVLHSKTAVTYSIGGEYQRLQLTAGMEKDAGPLGNAVLQIIVDGKVIKDVPIDAESPPLEMNIDVKDARQLSIIVDYGSRADLGDHVALGNARLLK